MKTVYYTENTDVKNPNPAPDLTEYLNISFLMSYEHHLFSLNQGENTIISQIRGVTPTERMYSA